MFSSWFLSHNLIQALLAPCEKDIMETGNNSDTGRAQGEISVISVWVGDKSPVVFVYVLRGRVSNMYYGRMGGRSWCQALFPGSCHSVGASYHQGSF